MKKFALFVKTPRHPLPRLVEFTATHDSILAYCLESETITAWIRKGTLRRLIDTHEALTPDDCEIFWEA